MLKTPAFVTTVYGQKYACFLGPHLHSIMQTHPGADGLVLWRDVPQREIDLLSGAFPSFRFERAKAAMDGSLHQRIPRKLHAWRDACRAFPDRPICLLDCDTLVLKPLDTFFEPGWDVTFTHKDARIPLNTGVMLVRTGEISQRVMDELSRRVETIVQNPAPQRARLDQSGARVLCTDNEAFFSRYQGLDEVCKPRAGAPITIHTWRPWMKGEDAIPSYGPTLGIILPTPGLATDRNAEALVMSQG